MNRLMLASRRLGAAALLSVVVLPHVAHADAIEDFYKGKMITLIISTGEGDGQDKMARLVARHWTNHIPGKPTIVAKNMPGAGNLRATNFLYGQAPKDGTTIGAIIPAFTLQQMLGGTGVNYDSAKFNWIGSSNTSNPTIHVWHTAGIASIEDAKKREVLMGGTGAGSNSVLYPTILNNIIGTKFKVIMGYRASGEVNLAMERGEVQGRAGETFNTLMANEPDWVRDKKINILVQIGREKEKGFENIPLATDFAKDAGSRDVLKVFGDVIALGRPYLAPPDVPKDRIAALRQSFDAAVKDPALLADAERAHLDISPTDGQTLQQVVAGMIHTNAEVLARVKQMVEASNADSDKGEKKQ
jgi:tripartite-type tricarboxylate transporter receptor subunit TctC